MRVSQQTTSWRKLFVGHVAHQNRAFVFVSAVTGPPETGANGAIDLAAVTLHATRVL
jgi:hypothetical protein